MLDRILASVAIACAIAPGAAGEVVQLQVPNRPPVGTNVLTGSFQGYSMEFASFPAIAGNYSAVPVRVGGTTANHGIWIPNQKQAIIQNFATPGADQPANSTWGPSYLESFKVLPKGTQYTVGVSFDDGDDGAKATVTEAQAFYSGLGNDIFAFEVGNEFDAFPVDRDTSTWSIKKYVPEWLDRTSVVAKSVLKKTDKKRFQAGPFVAPGTVSNDTTWTAKAAIDLGVASTGLARTFCTHQYFGAACTPVKPTLAGDLMNRTKMFPWMEYHREASSYSVSNGLPYVIGETNSIACQGLTGVSDVFGAAVWSVDYALYAASLNVSNIFWHMGTGYRYAAWQATQNGTTTTGPRPLYYGNVLVATALGDGNSQVVPIVNTTSLAGYAVYSSKSRKASLRSIVLVNMDVFNSTSTPASSRPSAEFKLPAELCGKNSKVSVQRLTAPGAEVRDGITFAGQTVALDGKISGQSKKQFMAGDTVIVYASEAVLLQIE
ncbi:uncharacterized protein CC84DRAFT_1250585 [Paraphaeosphaeria sporulosa]|uniref:Beta-glucuronidase C-terminal domain-containing protein n=1 Tax=Paraphaeosphaeria sporulosa TaxID=1460663 RepID=A0A177C6F3_9PLEO|nr:uncharacterized protein CC84DRAFT_1250585 [Paraphaeosphaeria sporulosa]OAG02711.1 hypothetical protein CC84DRAFT_1250585 [Paraphaeosphaeria sporulosa]